MDISKADARSPDLDLSAFKGSNLTQVCFGEHEIEFRFTPPRIISAEGRWELLDASGAVLDLAARGAYRDKNAYRVHLLLGQAVEGWSVDPPKAFSLTFGNALVLRVYDDSERYESFSIQPGDIFI